METEPVLQHSLSVAASDSLIHISCFCISCACYLCAESSREKTPGHEVGTVRGLANKLPGQTLAPQFQAC